MKWRPTDNVPIMLVGAGLWLGGAILFWLGFTVAGLGLIVVGFFLVGAL